VPPEEQEKFDALPDQYTHLIGHCWGLAAVICFQTLCGLRQKSD